MLRLRELRLNKGFSQTKLAEILGVTYFSVGDWERGKCQPSIELLLKLSDVFECTVDYLIGREDDFGNITISNGSAELLQDEQRLLTAYRSLSDIEKEKLIDDAEFYAKRYNSEKIRKGNNS